MMNTQFRSVRPSKDEYAGYYEPYVNRVSDGNIVETMQSQIADTLKLIRNLSDQQAMTVYSPGKWNIKEVVGHVIDGERIFAYRALRIARNDKTPLPSFDENEYAKLGGYNIRTIQDIAAELEHVRTATVDLFSHLDQDAFLRRGVASGHEVSVRAIGWVIAGHERHHRSVLLERYLS